MSGFAHPESLASTRWVVEHVDDPSVRLIEVVWGTSPQFDRTTYDGGPVPEYLRLLVGRNWLTTGRAAQQYTAHEYCPVVHTPGGR